MFLNEFLTWGSLALTYFFTTTLAIVAAACLLRSKRGKGSIAFKKYSNISSREFARVANDN